MLIFPQGTRAKTVKIEGDNAKEGVAMFSMRTDTPVVPMMFVKKNIILFSFSNYEVMF